jgi:hypothetical protein
MAAEGVSGDALVAHREGCAKCCARLVRGGALRLAHRSLVIEDRRTPGMGLSQADLGKLLRTLARP